MHLPFIIPRESDVVAFKANCSRSLTVPFPGLDSDERAKHWMGIGLGERRFENDERLFAL